MKKVFLFSGQGAQYPGMMKYLFDNFVSNRKVIEVANRVTGKDIGKLMFDGPQDDLNQTENTQPCVLAADIMAYEALKECGYSPDAVAGFSLGEYAALYASGVFDLETVFKIIVVRANAMKNACIGINGSMAAILGCTKEKVEELCSKANGYVVPVNFNCTGQIAISGEDAAVDEVIMLCKEEKIRAVKLQVSVPCHCKFMIPASQELEKLFTNVNFKEPVLPIYMNVDGMSESNTKAIKQKLVKQIKEPVQWIK